MFDLWPIRDKEESEISGPPLVTLYEDEKAVTFPCKIILIFFRNREFQLDNQIIQETVPNFLWRLCNEETVMKLWVAG